ncbi:MAG: SsrA-binding protein SmpB [Planctomycetota bacterium]
MSDSRAKGAEAPRLVVENRKARFKYEVLETVETGMVLVGTEVKTLRGGTVHLDESYARVQDDELFLIGAHIAEYTHGNRQNHLPTRRRKLLLRKAQLRKLKARTEQKGLTLVPLRIYFNERGIAKLELGICRGKKTHDKREAAKGKAAAREMREG